MADCFMGLPRGDPAGSPSMGAEGWVDRWDRVGVVCRTAGGDRAAELLSASAAPTSEVGGVDMGWEAVGAAVEEAAEAPTGAAAPV